MQVADKYNHTSFEISVVIPTCNRKGRLLSLLDNLNESAYATSEVIVVDSSDDNMEPGTFDPFKNLNILYIRSEKSVCLQRNLGIQQAISPWIFLCDDDIEVPKDYLKKLISHIKAYPKVGALSGIVLERFQNEWQSGYPISSAFELVWKFIFQLGLWGEITSPSNNILIKRIKTYYLKKGNHISKAGWPVITDFSGDYFISPVYGLGASLIRKSWLIHSPYDEVLDKHGIGDNYGVALGFPSIGIHILNNAFVYHHQEPENRLQKPLQYLRRTIALDYFTSTKKHLSHVKKSWLVWSLWGNVLAFLRSKDLVMAKAALKSVWLVSAKKNIYLKQLAVRKEIR